LPTKNYRKNWSVDSAGPNTKTKMKLAWAHVKKNDDSIIKQALQWTPQGPEEEGDQGILGKKDPKQEMWTVGYKYSSKGPHPLLGT